MKKTILVLVVLVLIIGVVWYFSADDAPTQEANTEAETETMQAADTTAEAETPEELSGMGSLQNILGLGDNVRCEFKSSFEGQTSEGTFVTDGERFRMEATVQDSEAGTITSNIINDGSNTYTWGTTAEGTMAVKMANQEVEGDSTANYPSAVPPEQAQVDFQQEVEYDCDRWSVDSSAFVPPSDVEFMDLEAMMQEAMQGMPEGFEMPAGFPAN